MVTNSSSWKHSGFSVHSSRLIKAEDEDSRKTLREYISRAPFSLERMSFKEDVTDSADISRLLYFAAIWSGGRTSEVWMQGFNALRTHVGEISRSPSSGRVEQLARQMNLLSGNTDTSIYLPPDVASNCFGACLSEASALLELGYPRDEPALFTTSLPSPARNSIRTHHQIRSAVHHLGGDFELLKALFRTEDSTGPCLELTFAVWLPQRVPENISTTSPDFRFFSETFMSEFEPI